MPANAVLPYIDAHCHTHGLPFDAWETLGSSGCAAVVLSVGNPHVYREIHPEVPDWNVMRHYWEGAIRFAPEAERTHFMKVFVAVGISFMTYWREWQLAIDALPEFLRMPHVVAIGETGIDPWQYWGYQWPADEGEQAFAEQIRIAKEHDLPVILHTPTQRKGFMPEMPPDRYKRHFLDQDLEIINRIGLDHRRIVIDHADETILEHALKETKAYIGIGVGVTLRRTGPIFFADTIERFGSERFLINTDHMAELACDLLAVPKTIREMRRRGIDEASIHRVVFDNANECFRLGLADGR